MNDLDPMNVVAMLRHMINQHEDGEWRHSEVVALADKLEAEVLGEQFGRLDDPENDKYGDPNCGLCN